MSDSSDPMDCSPPGSSVHGIFQAKVLEWPERHPGFALWLALQFSHSVVSDSSDPMDCSLPGSSVQGIFHAKVLEWGATAFKYIYK